MVPYINLAKKQFSRVQVVALPVRMRAPTWGRFHKMLILSIHIFPPYDVYRMSFISL